MLKDKIDHCYLINLDERTDRLNKASKQCKAINLPFERFSAINGSSLDVEIKPYRLHDSPYWNKGAYGLVLTTINIIKDAKAKGYKSILILEDDVEFHKDINAIFDAYYPYIPDNYHMVYLGAQHVADPKPFKGNLKQVSYAFCCHAYIINECIYDFYLSVLNKKNKQLDIMTAEDIQLIGKSYCFAPNLAYQTPNYSNIQNTNVNYSFLKKA
jgi:GR25 family glycosyltransferase involved in LPS biosynthesis